MRTFYELILQRRTVRRFKQDPIPTELLEQMINAARLAPSANNLQPLEFIVVNQPDLLPSVFDTTQWAGYIKPKGTPKKGEQPVAYVVVLINQKIRSGGGEHDCGSAMMNMIYTALEKGVASCWIRSIDREKLHNILAIPPHFDIDSILALGYPAEKPVVDVASDSIKYWKDRKEVLHVSKRKMEDILHWNGF